MTGRILRWANITRQAVKSNHQLLFVFGDNMTRRGMGGQAAAMRGEPNAIGIPTKWSPGWQDQDYFTDMVLDSSQVMAAIDAGFETIRLTLQSGHSVVIPKAFIGTGYAQMPERSPRLYQYMVWELERIQAQYR